MTTPTALAEISTARAAVHAAAEAADRAATRHAAARSRLAAALAIWEAANHDHADPDVGIFAVTTVVVAD